MQFCYPRWIYRQCSISNTEDIFYKNTTSPGLLYLELKTCFNSLSFGIASRGPPFDIQPVRKPESRTDTKLPELRKIKFVFLCIYHVF
jgi:hypothetical protein